ncbi:MAG TPA: hypothetical protein VF516_41620, partial [Kofleriaceae bacterium]
DGGLQRGQRDPVGAGLGEPTGLLVGPDHALVEQGAIGVEVDQAGQGAQRELAIAGSTGPSAGRSARRSTSSTAGPACRPSRAPGRRFRDRRSSPIS